MAAKVEGDYGDSGSYDDYGDGGSYEDYGDGGSYEDYDGGGDYEDYGDGGDCGEYGDDGNYGETRQKQRASHQQFILPQFLMEDPQALREQEQNQMQRFILPVPSSDRAPPMQLSF